MFEKFFNLLDRIRQKSPETKSAISFTISFIITLIIATFWFVDYMEKAQIKLSDRPLGEIIEPVKDFSASVNGKTDDSF